MFCLREGPNILYFYNPAYRIAQAGFLSVKISGICSAGYKVSAIRPTYGTSQVVYLLLFIRYEIFGSKEFQPPKKQ